MAVHRSRIGSRLQIMSQRLRGELTNRHRVRHDDDRNNPAHLVNYPINRFAGIKGSCDLSSLDSVVGKMLDEIDLLRRVAISS